MPGALQECVALVTGASSGIGAATASTLADHGATVALLSRRRDRLEDLAVQIRERGGKASVHEADVTDADVARAAVDQVVADLGRLDVVVNNAGWLENAPALDADLADWHHMVDVNLTGVLNLTHAALPHLVAAAASPRGVADLVTLSSIAGRKVPSPASNVYAATKHAVAAFSEAVRTEMTEHQVRVGLVEPGLVRTEMTTSGRENNPDARSGAPLEAKDVADAIVWMVTRPAHAAINEILIRPTEQQR